MNTRAEDKAEVHRHKLLSQFEDPKTRRLWADRPARLRRLYLALFLSLLSTAALTGLALSQSPLALIVTSFTLCVLLLPQTAVLQFLEAGSRTLHGYEQVVDERQRTEIDQARNLGHTVTSALLILAVAITGAAHLLSTFPLTDLNVPIGLFLPVAWVVLLLHRTFPAFYLAWVQPDEPHDEDGLVG